ncbi:hypothetical protein ACQJ23_27525, partial [Pseudomonas bananamidigenes]
KVDGVVDGVLPADTDGTTLTVEYLNTVKDDEVTYFWNGSKTGPDSDSVKLSSFTAGQPVPFTIKAELIKGNEGGTVEASYSIKWADERPTSYSDVKAFSVGVALELKAPKIKEAPNDLSLIPNAAKDALTAIVDYEGMRIGDKIIAKWTGAAGAPAEGSYTAPEKPVTVLGAQEIPLANSVVAFNLNKAVTVSYTVKRGSGEPLPSDTRILAVQSLVLDLSNVPKILQAANNGDGLELNVSALTGNATLRALDWPFIALKQRVWMHLSGMKSDNTPYAKTLWNGGNAQTNQGWIDNGHYDTAVLKTELQALKDGSSLRIAFKAGLSGSLAENDAVTFPERTYTVKAIADVKPEITRAEDSKGVEILPGAYTVDTSVTLIGTAAPGQKVQLRDGATLDGQPTADPGTGIWRHTLTGRTLTLHTFTAQALYGSGQTSDPRTLTVTAAMPPTITRVNENTATGAAVPNGGITVATTLVFKGRASAGQQLQLLDGGALKGTITVDSNGDYSHHLTGQSAGAHSYTVKATYGALPESQPWKLNISAATSGIENFLILDDFNLREIEESITTPNGLLVTNVLDNGNHMMGIHNDKGTGLTIGPGRRGRIKFTGHANKVVIKCRAFYTNKQLTFIVDYYDLNQQRLVRQTPTITTLTEVTYTAPSGGNLSYVEIECSTGLNWAIAPEVIWL